MNENNYDYLAKQTKFSGFGEAHQDELKQKMQHLAPEFSIIHEQQFGNDATTATLQFKKSTSSDMYFFNSYRLELNNKPPGTPVKQTFYTSDGFTLKEAYNMLTGRSVQKEKLNKEQEKFAAWFSINFSENDSHGNFKLNTYYPNYGFDLEKSLAQHPIRELGDAQQKQWLMDSLHRGNRQAVTLQINGQEKKLFVEASPKFKSLNFYDDVHQRIKPENLYETSTAVPDNKLADEKKALDKGEAPQQKQTRETDNKQKQAKQKKKAIKR